jgi:hypothetical protein
MSAIYTATSGHTFKHVCPSGPLCEAWADLDNDFASEPISCGHDSCLAILHEGCEACFIESMDEYTAQLAAFDDYAHDAEGQAATFARLASYNY